MIFDLENFANNRTMIVDLEGFANLTDTFSANLTIDFGSWTKSGGTYNFSDNDWTKLSKSLLQNKTELAQKKDTEFSIINYLKDIF